MSWHVDVYSIKMLLLTIGMWYEGGRTGSTQGWLFSQAFDWCCEEPSPRTGGMASHSMFHMVLSANLSERLSLQIGRFASHQQCHPNTSCWEQEALWGGCASGFGLQILISFRTPVKHFLLSLGLKIMRKGIWENFDTVQSVFWCTYAASYLDQSLFVLSFWLS